MDEALSKESRPGKPRLNDSRSRHAMMAHPRAVSIALAFVMVATALLQLPGSDVPVVQAQSGGDICAGALALRTFDVVAIDIRVVYNHFGDHDPQGRLFVLAENEQALRDQVAAEPFDVASLAEPLVVRAHLGDCVIFNVANGLSGSEDVSFHVHGLVARAGQGLHLGDNDDDTVPPGGIRQYKVFIPNDPALEGAHFLHSHDRFQQRHGMFGALVAQPAGVAWTAPDGSTPFNSGDQAIIVDPSGSDHREFIVIYHDEIGDGPEGLTQKNGRQMPQVSEFGEYGPGTKGMNLRSEPFRTRFQASDDEAGQHLKSQGYGSYTYGDPGIFVPESYLGDPTKFRLVNAGPGQHHVHHLHGGGDRWRFSPVSDVTQFDAVSLNGNDPIKDNPIVRSQSERVDVQNLGPGESFNAFIEGGSGGTQASVGDFLFHCHIAEHYISGMWSFWRVFNTAQDHLAELPDRTGLFKPPVNSVDLLSAPAAAKYDLDETTVRDWVESQLPDQGVANGFNDASVWDWVVEETPEGALYKGEPETALVWGNFPADHPDRLPAGQRPELLFNQDNGRLEWPTLRPHLGERPPFAAGHGPAPYLDGARVPDPAVDADNLCPPNLPAERMRSYRVVALGGVDVPYNNQDVDSGGQIFVHAEDKEAVLSGAKPAKSFVIRANQGDCVDIILTSQLSGAPGFRTEGSKVNMHIHLVQFDVQASDGVITGAAFEQSVRPAPETGTTLFAGASPGDTMITVADGTKLRAGTTIGIGLTEANVEVRGILSIVGNIVTLDAPLDNPHASGERTGTEFVKYRWYADVELGIVYWHDHVDGLNSWRRGLFASIVIEPAGSRWCDPAREAPGACSEDVLDGHVLDIVNTDPAKQQDKTYTFREYVVQAQENGGPDAEWTSLNLRNAPFDQRFDGNPLSSAGNGDPATDLWQAYPGDPFKVRLLYGGQGDADTDCDGFCLAWSRGVSTFGVTGHRFANEQFNPNSRLMDRQSFGISDMKNWQVDCAGGGPVLSTGECARQAGDYLYYMTTPSFFERGSWGILRVHDELQDCSGSGGGGAGGPAEKVWINEFDQDPDRDDDWAELWNNGPTTVDLSGWLLQSTNDGDVISLSGTIAPGAFKVFDERRWLSSSSESIELRDAEGNLVDSTPEFSDFEEDDRSWQRTPDGTDTWEFRDRTKGASNGDGGGGGAPAPCLQVLPSNGDISTAPLPTGPVRRYDVVAMNDVVDFNVGEDISESRAIFALQSDQAAIQAGTLNPQPLVLRALPGETVEISLLNTLSEKVTLHASMLLCDPATSLGIPVGDNPAAAIEVPPGGTKTFRCFADREATGWLRSFGDGTLPRAGLDDDDRDRHGGSGGFAANSLYGAIVVEPDGSSFSSDTGPVSTLTVGASTWTEQVLLYENQDNLLMSSIMPYIEEPVGIVAINYRTEPLRERDFSLDPNKPMDLSVFSSAQHGDPETPIIEVGAGGNLVVRSVGGEGDQLQVHVVEGHWWKRDPNMAGSNVVDFATLGPGETSDAWIANVGPGGPGDYLYGNHRLAMMHGGQWGILRVT